MSNTQTALAKKEQETIKKYLEILDTPGKTKLHDRTKQIVGLDDGITTWQDIERVHDLSIITDILEVMIDDVKETRDAKMLGSIGRLIQAKNNILGDINPAPKKSISVVVRADQEDVHKTTVGTNTVTIDKEDYEVVENVPKKEEECRE